MARTSPRRRALLGGAVLAAVLAGGTTGAAAGDIGGAIAPGAAAATGATSAVVACEPDLAAARVMNGAAGGEPKLFPDNEAKAYGVLPDKPTMPSGSVTVETVVHSISDHQLSAAEKARKEAMIKAQMDVLNASFAGKTAPGAADTPFRFKLAKVDWVVNADWYHVSPGKAERDMKRALYVGDSETLNVYSADIGGGLLGWAYFPKDYNFGRDYIDGVVMLDESMPGGTAGKYAEGDTLTHEVGQWLMLHHTFNAGCSASGDFVADTPKEAYPQFNCPVGADSCAAPGLDPIHNFMDYSQDSCMNMFTQGQADRMSDGWLAFRAGGRG